MMNTKEWACKNPIQYKNGLGHRVTYGWNTNGSGFINTQLNIGLGVVEIQMSVFINTQLKIELVVAKKNQSGFINILLNITSIMTRI
jgi:hypothetical protein